MIKKADFSCKEICNIILRESPSPTYATLADGATSWPPPHRVMFGEQIFQSVRPSVGQWGPPAWLHHLAVIRTQRNTRVNATTALVLSCLWIYISQHVCLCLHFVCAPQSYTTTEQKRNSRNRKLNLKGSGRDLYPQGLKGSSAEGKWKSRGGATFTKSLTLQSTWPFYPWVYSILSQLSCP